jgi:hypothetical protein
VLFSGGGVRGVAFAGCLKVLWTEHHIDWGQRCPALHSVNGCSIGALYAFLIALGYTCNEIEDIARTSRPEHFVNIDFTRIFPGKQLSLDSAECVKGLLVDWMMKKCPEVDSVRQALTYTLKELSDRKKIKLGIWVTHLDSRELEKAHDSNSVIQSVLASMALPPIYPSVTLTTNQGKTAQYADGGLANFFPLLYEPPGTLGFRLLQKPFREDQVKKSQQPFLCYLTLALDIAISGKEEFQWNQLSAAQQQSTITIVCGTALGSMDLGIGDTEQSEVFQAGCRAMKDYMNSCV